MAAAFVYLPLVAGGFPLSHDHPVHLYKAWYFWEHLLTEGRLSGWTSDWFLGYPFARLYPIGTDAWVAAIRALTLGLVDWPETYGIAVYAAMVALTHAVFRFGRQYAGTAAGLIGALLWLGDRGAFREGGWTYLVDYGVWGQALGLLFLLHGLVWLDRPRGGPLAALSIALAALAHAMTLPALCVAMPAWVLLRRSWRRALAVLIVAAACSAFWYVPWFGYLGWGNNIGEEGPPLRRLVWGLLSGSPWVGGWSHVGPVILLGVGVTLRRRDRGAALLATIGLGLTWLSAWDTYALVLQHLGGFFQNLQYERFAIHAKPALFVLAGVGIVRAARPLAALAGLLLVVDAVDEVPGLADQRWLLPTRETAGWWDELGELSGWLRRAQVEDPRFWRVAIDLGTHDHRLFLLPMLAGTPVYKVGYTPARSLRDVPTRGEAALYELASVKYVVDDQPQGAAACFGTLCVHAGEYSPARARMIGPGSVRVARFLDEHIEIDVTGVTAESRVLVHLDIFPPWRATLDGAPLPIVPTAAAEDAPASLVGLRPPHDGRIVLTYGEEAPARVGLAISALGVVLLGIWAAKSRKAAPKDGLSSE